MPSRSPTRQITDCGIWLQTLPALPHHPQTQIEQGALCSPNRDAERPLPAIRLRNISPTRWQRSIRSCLDARTEIREVLLEAFRVLGPCHLVDAGRGELLQPEEARPQNIDGEMMQERR